MNVETIPARPTGDDASYDPGSVRITAGGLLRSEWRKLWSVRSLWITLAAGFGLIMALCGYMILDGRTLGRGQAADIPFGWTAIYPVGMLVLVVLGVLSVSTEYSSGSIRTSLTVNPRRTGVMLAKAAVITGIVAALAAVTSVLLYLLLQSARTVPSAVGMSLIAPNMFWGVLGGTLMLPYGALFGVLLGWLIRNAAGAICLYFGVFQMGPQILPALLPEPFSGIKDFMPLAAINVMRSGGLATEPYRLGVAIVVLILWLAMLGAAAWWRLKRRDA
ncbi:ABC transporter permease [Streptosporangium sp. NPDC006013]|uniref:ABC transporter permease n=1 Tax=Streptosporangium sp. NPDC006013 TaxID=3155596 RepID=UPI0033B48B10